MQINYLVPRLRCCRSHVQTAQAPAPERQIINAQAPIERNVQLPAPIDPHSARALLTLHGLLLVTAYAAEPPGAGPGPPGPAGAATAAGDAGDAPHAADGGLGNTGVVPEGDAMEGAA